MPEARLQVDDVLGRRVVPIAKAPFEIGRRETNDLRLAGSEVSRDHAEIVKVQNGICPARPDVALRDVRQRRTGYRANPCPRRSHPAWAERWRGDDLPHRRIRRRPPRQTATTTAVGDLRQIATLLEGLRALGTGRVLDDVLSMVLDSAIEVSGAERGFIMLAPADGELEFKMARGRSHATLPGSSFATSRKIPEEVFRPASPPGRGPARR